MKISALIQGLSLATFLLVAGLPAYGASIYINQINPPVVQLDDAPIATILGEPGDTISWLGFIDTTGLTANLQSLTAFSIADLNEITEVTPRLAADYAQFFTDVSRQENVDPNTGLNTAIAVFSGTPGLPPNFKYKLNDFTATFGSQLNNDGKVSYRLGVLSAIDVNGRDVTDQFGAPPPRKGFQGFVIQPVAVPESSSIFGSVLAGGFGVFLRKQNRKVQY